MMSDPCVFYTDHLGTRILTLKKAEEMAVEARRQALECETRAVKLRREATNLERAMTCERDPAAELIQTVARRLQEAHRRHIDNEVAFRIVAEKILVDDVYPHLVKESGESHG